MLTMEVLKETAKEHDFMCLLHEKPFAGVNGSGKHNNWSVSTNTGINMMDPGSTPKNNARFMVVLAALTRGISVYGDLIRSAVATPGNDFRLGANEAPPAIISMYIGEQLAEVVNDIILEDQQQFEGGKPKLQRAGSKMQLGVNSLPTLPRDASDRNRTSPFAFTGNKFEFRAVGSSQSCARPGTILNTMMADSFNYVSDEIEKAMKTGLKSDVAIQSVVSKLLKEHNRVIFNGNGYSEEWKKEAERRGLPNLRTTPEAIKAFGSEKNIELFERMKVLSRREVLSAQSIMYENFIKTVAIEADCMLNMASAYILPVSLEYRQKVHTSIDSADAAQSEYAKSVNHSVSSLVSSIDNLKKTIEKAKSFHDEEHLEEQATFYRVDIFDAMAKTRSACDTLETMVDDRLWPFPKYSEILFLK
jgi:glutamine synthetase